MYFIISLFYHSYCFIIPFGITCSQTKNMNEVFWMFLGAAILYAFQKYESGEAYPSIVNTTSKKFFLLAIGYGYVVSVYNGDENVERIEALCEIRNKFFDEIVFDDGSMFVIGYNIYNNATNMTRYIEFESYANNSSEVETELANIKDTSQCCIYIYGNNRFLQNHTCGNLHKKFIAMFRAFVYVSFLIIATIILFFCEDGTVNRITVH